MGKLTITGASDDLIEIDGDFREEINWIPDDDETGYLAVSDGTLLTVVYGDHGLWRFSVVTKGRATFSKVEGVVDDDTNDVVTLEASEPFKHVLFGTKLAR